MVLSCISSNISKYSNSSFYNKNIQFFHPFILSFDSFQKAFGVEKSRTGIDEAGVEASDEAIETLEASIASETLDTLNAIDTLNSLKAMPALDEYQTYKKKKPEQVLMVSPGMRVLF